MGSTWLLLHSNISGGMKIRSSHYFQSNQNRLEVAECSPPAINSTSHRPCQHQGEFTVLRMKLQNTHMREQRVVQLLFPIILTFLSNVWWTNVSSGAGTKQGQLKIRNIHSWECFLRDRHMKRTDNRTIQYIQNISRAWVSLCKKKKESRSGLHFLIRFESHKRKD